MNDTHRRQLLDAIGIGPTWVRRALPAVMVDGGASAASVADPVALMPIETADTADTALAVDANPPAMGAPVRMETATALSPATNMDWAQLQAAIAACRLCGLCEGRTHTVPGVGDAKARWLFIGEGPGQSEDLQGEPFVGPAGKLLDNMLAAIGLRRGDNVYITNVVKCHPTDESGHDRAPSAAEIAACLPYLQRQIALIQPTMMVALGKTAALSLLGLPPSTTVAALRGTVHRYGELPLIVTYHPAYLLRQPSDKAKAWADLCLATATYAA
ncbi:uracil-DNA glycosylase [Herbaspirillum sp. RTI4]|uniref:uracil-DNA glycosylase n=1 Tax=Herbaspirillum sp. RTI4 TaxID=3048640 RepID=UPI002AB4E05A|nr:uracil-DNA glycosylase [Herbaspirillum sp. RTI4]MDY7578651.1 uracil-DNA glycosylase [Herbaspirillum sp. RTI4]MEA9980651.1 uracil-DNA glycosylase [Herbaspirillum sp. RTI4]